MENKYNSFESIIIYIYLYINCIILVFSIRNTQTNKQTTLVINKSIKI